MMRSLYGHKAIASSVESPVWQSELMNLLPPEKSEIRSTKSETNPNRQIQNPNVQNADR
jgi:hypothetical protein